jgi:hypothetical protein
MVSILIDILPTAAYLGSFNAGVFIVLHEIMGKTEIVAASFGLFACAIIFLSTDLLFDYSRVSKHLLK